MSTPYQTIPVTCPRCRHRFLAPVKAIIDVGLEPADKVRLLSGQLNIAACPQCGSAGMLNTPLVYHDPGKALFFVFLPPELSLPEAEQQRIIGSLTQQVMSTLPAERRKGYLFNPRTFLSLDGMLTAILEADGITPEMLEAQQARVRLLEQLLAASDSDARRALVDAQPELVDYEFFELLAANTELAHSSEQRQQMAQALTQLRDELLEWTTVGKEVAGRQRAIDALGDGITREGLLDRLIEAAQAEDDIAVETMVAVARPAIDYVFYQQLTEKIEQAEAKGQLDLARILRALRERILDLTQELDEQVRQAAEQATRRLQKLLQAEDLEAAVKEELPQIQDLGLFLSVLAANVQAAEEANRSQVLDRLRNVSELIFRAIEEASPPEIKLINRLLGAEYPDGTRALLQEQRAHVDDNLLELMQLMQAEMAQSDRSELAKRLEQIHSQAQAMLSIQTT